MLNHNEFFVHRKITLIQHGYDQRSLANKIGVSNATVHNVMTNKTKNSRNVHEAVAAVLGVSLAEFWPELYGPDVVGSKISNHNTTPDNFEKNLTEGRP